MAYYNDPRGKKPRDHEPIQTKKPATAPGKRTYSERLPPLQKAPPAAVLANGASAPPFQAMHADAAFRPDLYSTTQPVQATRTLTSLRDWPDRSQGADATAVQRKETPAGTVTIERGQLTTLGEGSDSQTKFIHWPNTNSSGVTLGKGYDIGSRSAQQVIDELTAAGMSADQATKISKGAGLKGQAANQFVKAHKSSIGEIPTDVQRTLLQTMLTAYTERARQTATSTKADSQNRNAAGREKSEGKAAGTYVMSDEEWDGMHPAMHEFLTDLIYQGGYYGWDRVAKINAAVKAHNGDHLGQFKAVRELFTNGYMDVYAGKIGEGKGGKGAKFSGYGQQLDYSGGYRRNTIRVAYLNHVISALEAGKTVTVAGTSASAGGETGAQPEATTPPPLPGPEPAAPAPAAGAPAAGATPATDPQPAGGTQQAIKYVVKHGESLGILAKKFAVSIDAIKAANADKLKTWGTVQGFFAGETIEIPATREAAPVSAQVAPPAALETAPRPQPRPEQTEQQAEQAEQAAKPAPQATQQPAPEQTPKPASEPKAKPAAEPKAEPEAQPNYLSGEIQESVGAGGVNKASDVSIIQQNLINLGYLSADAEVEAARAADPNAVLSSIPNTIKAIEQYQQFGLGTGADGRVDVGGNTWKHMTGRLEMIQEYAGHQIQTEPIDSVLSPSNWISQFPTDESKNGAGRGLLESEKARPGKNNNVCCWDAAQAMVKQHGGSLTHEVSSRLPTLLQQDGATNVLGGQAQLGVKYIDKQLLAGKPVMIGVDDGRVKAYNADATTEHFIVIVGKVVNGGQVAYRYFDPGTRYGSKGYSENNQLSLGADYSLTGKSYSGSKDYRLAQVRQNR